MVFVLAGVVAAGCNCGGRRWEGRREEWNMADGGGQMAADCRPRCLCHTSPSECTVIMFISELI